MVFWDKRQIAMQGPHCEMSAANCHKSFRLQSWFANWQWMNWTSSWNYIAPLWAIQIKWVEQMLWRVKIEPTAKKWDAFGHTGHFVGGSQLWMFRSSRSMISTLTLTLTLVAIWLIPNLNSRGHHVPILQPGEALLPQRLPHPLLLPL